MRIYVAGQMTGKPLYNFKAFKEAQKVWGWKGHEVLTPFDASNVVWQRYFGKDFDPSTDSCEYGSDVMLDCWREDTNILLWSEAVVLLRGWEQSRGSRIEVQTALLFGKKLYSAELHIELKLKAEVAFIKEE